MSAIYHIHPHYTGVTIWHAKGNQRTRVSTIVCDKGLTRYARYVVVREIVQGACLGVPTYVFTKTDKRIEHEILLKSGLRGWRGRLRAVYAGTGLDDFRNHCRIFNLHRRLGFKTPEAAWKENPAVEGGVNPADYRKVKQCPS